MISFSYVNGIESYIPAADPFLSMERELTEMSDTIDNVISEGLTSYRQYVIESGDDSSFQIFMEKEGQNIFAKIGNAIIDMVKKIVQFITNKVDKLKDYKLDKKLEKNIDKAFASATPEEKKDIEALLKEGLSNGLVSIKDLTELSKINQAYNDLLKSIADSKVDPKSLKGKAKSLNDMLKKANESGVVNAAKAITAVGGAIGVGYILKKNILDARNSAETARKNAVNNANAFAAALNTVSQMPDMGDSTRINALQTAKNAQFFMNGQYSKMVALNDQSVSKFRAAISKIPLIGGAADRAHEKKIDAQHAKNQKYRDIYMYDQLIKNAEKDKKNKQGNGNSNK